MLSGLVLLFQTSVSPILKMDSINSPPAAYATRGGEDVV